MAASRARESMADLYLDLQASAREEKYRREVEEQRRRCVEDNLKEAKMEMNRLRDRLLLNRYSGLNLSGYWTNLSC